MFSQNFNPTGSLTVSAIVAALPLLALLITLGGFKWRAHWAGAASLVIAIGVASAAYHMPFGQTLDAGVLGAAQGLLKAPPPTLNLTVPDLYKVEADSQLWILNMGTQAATPEIGGKATPVPALSIVRQALP